MSSDANPVLGSSSSSRQAHFPSTTNREPDSSLHKHTSTAVEGGHGISAASVAFSAPFSTAQPSEDLRASTPPSFIFTLYQQLQGQIRHTLADQVTPLRLAGHLSVLAVGAVILVMSQVQLPEWDISFSALPNNALGMAENAPVADVTLPQSIGTVAAELTNDALKKSAAPFTVVQEKPRESIEVYTVKAGDTVLGIAAQFGVQPETIMWANTAIEQDPDRLSIGDQLNILPLDGVLHIVKPGDTLASLAAKYKVDSSAIIGYTANELADSSATLQIGSQVVVPGGSKPFITPQVPSVATLGSAPSDAVKGSGSFSWPTSGNITQRFWGGHRAIDIGSWVGAPVKATDGGYVVLAGGGWNGGYGNHVIIDHGNGFTSLYAHLNSIFVKPGENISRGQQIGTVGNTGNSTGPHLHFEIRYQGVPRNPYNWLP